MGRGRAKAKQTKVARELKYRSTHTDFSSLERELRGDEYQVPAAYADLVEDDEDADPDDYGDEDDGDDYAVPRDEDYGHLRKSG
ncbi:DUF3073 domain-containing protein [Microlunatus ginsengisoli]|uniref:DUF3073 domain-containing protein n=1 Tax=Microlunatus ginsengisoli TaxID=363863 RepID=A0ABP7A453_9ACTN